MGNGNTLASDRKATRAYADQEGSNDSSESRAKQTTGGARGWLGPIALLSVLALVGFGLFYWKGMSAEQAAASAANMPEPAETVTVATARTRQYQRTTTSIGTVVALRSVALRNEVAGTVATANLEPGQVVEAGAVLIALDVSVEQAELNALKAQATLARNLADRMQRALQGRATSQIELDRALAELDMARAQIARTEAIIARKTIRAPFKARVGLSDIHPGQYLNEGTLITYLQGVDEATQVDFAIPQHVAETLKTGTEVSIVTGQGRSPVSAQIVAIDSRADPATRNVTIRARVAKAELLPAPGGSVRVEVPSGAPIAAVSIPVNAVRKGPEGDHVFLIAADAAGSPRAQMQRVQSGAILGDDMLILSGLKPGDEVASVGSFKLFGGMLVNVVDETPSQARN